MNQYQIDEAAALLAAARTSGRPGARLPESCRPLDLESALAIQRRTWPAGAGDRRLEVLAAAGAGPDQRGADPRDDLPRVAVRDRGDGRHCADRTRSRVRDGARSPAARRALFGRGSARRDRRNAAGAGASRHALRRSRGRRLAGDDGGLRAEPGPLRRADRARWPRCAARWRSRSRYATNGGVLSTHDGRMATAIRCARSSGSRISSRRAAKGCARGRSSPPARMRARSRFRWTSRSRSRSASSAW